MTERTEDRLRAALRADVEDVDADPDTWRHVQREVAARKASARRHRRVAFVAAAAAVVIAVIGATAMIDREPDGTSVDVRPADDPTTTAPPVDDTVVDQAPMLAIWPFATDDDVAAYLADPGIGMFRDPEATALEFAREYLNMPDPVAPRGYAAAEGLSGSVEVLPRAGSPMMTRVWVHRYGGDEGAYSVYFAETANIELDREAVGESVAAPVVAVSGTSTAFEAHVDVEVRDADGRVLGQAFVMGGANGEMGPFAGEVRIDEPTTSTGALLLTTSSAEDGSLQEATVMPITFAVEQSSFSVFFHRDEELVEVTRTGPKTVGVLRQALDALVAGPRPEDGEGLSSLFSAETADVLAGVSLREGTAVVDFAHAVNNASTSAGSVAFLAELDATIFQFATVERIEYRLQGSCEAFWEHLQHGRTCPLRERT